MQNESPLFIKLDLFPPTPGRGWKHKIKVQINQPVDHFLPVDYKGVAYKKACKKEIKLMIHSFSSSFKVIGFLPDFFCFNCIRALYFFAKLVTISFFLRGLLGNASSALLREWCLVALCLNDDVRVSVSSVSVPSLVGAGEGRSICSNFLFLVNLFLSLSFLYFVLLFVAIFDVVPFKPLPFFVLLTYFVDIFISIFAAIFVVLVHDDRLESSTSHSNSCFLFQK